MTKAQETALKLFNDVKDKASTEKIGRSIVKYTWQEDGWRYDFFTFDGILKKVEAFNHRELIEVQL